MIFPERNCFGCTAHWDISTPQGLSSYCAEFGEPIDSEVIAAADCDAFHPRACQHTLTRWTTRTDELGFLAWARCVDCGALVTTHARAIEGQIP